MNTQAQTDTDKQPHLFFSSEEVCDMTYSAYHYDPIANLSTSRNVEGYQLYKFRDVRDMRHSTSKEQQQQQQSTTAPLDRNVNVGIRINRGHPVLYIPGHWGHYQQSRSLGAHGIHLTGQNWRTLSDGASIRQLVNASYTNGQATFGQEEGGGGVAHFLYDVYALDFGNGEGGAMHGFRLWQQQKAVREAVRVLAQAYYNNDPTATTDKQQQQQQQAVVNKVTIVAHSVGGLVARAALLPLSWSMHLKNHGGGGCEYKGDEHEDHDVIMEEYVDTVITLATPHGGLPYACDGSVHAFYNWVLHGRHQSMAKLDDERVLTQAQNKKEVLLVSLSGGWRDELIPPSLCHAQDVESSMGGRRRFVTLSALASDVMYPPQTKKERQNTQNVVGGMDHRSIVWCHGVLAKIRNVIQTAATVDSTTSQEGLELVKRVLWGGKGGGGGFEEEDYMAALAKHEEKVFQHLLGGSKFARVALEASSYAFNVELLLTFYVLIAMFRQLGITPTFLPTRHETWRGSYYFGDMRNCLGVILLVTVKSRFKLASMSSLTGRNTVETLRLLVRQFLTPTGAVPGETPVVSVMTLVVLASWAEMMYFMLTRVVFALMVDGFGQWCMERKRRRGKLCCNETDMLKSPNGKEQAEEQKDREAEMSNNHAPSSSLSSGVSCNTRPGRGLVYFAVTFMLMHMGLLLPTKIHSKDIDKNVVLFLVGARALLFLLHLMFTCLLVFVVILHGSRAWEKERRCCYHEVVALVLAFPPLCVGKIMYAWSLTSRLWLCFTKTDMTCSSLGLSPCDVLGVYGCQDLGLELTWFGLVTFVPMTCQLLLTIGAVTRDGNARATLAAVEARWIAMKMQSDIRPKDMGGKRFHGVVSILCRSMRWLLLLFVIDSCCIDFLQSKSLQGSFPTLLLAGGGSRLVKVISMACFAQCFSGLVSSFAVPKVYQDEKQDKGAETEKTKND